MLRFFCVALAVSLWIQGGVGDYLFPDAAASLGFRTFGIIKGAIGGMIGVAVYLAVSHFRARNKEAAPRSEPPSLR
jgi:hypothetical protein